MQALIAQTKTQLIAEMDGLAAAWNSSCAANALDTFQNINSLTPDNLQAFAISSDKCVTDAQAVIGAAATKAAIDKIGFALNTVGPIAYAVNAKAGFPTDQLLQHIMQANQLIKTKLTPYCEVSINSPDDLPDFSGPVTGHGACFNFKLPTPPRVEVGEHGGVFYLTPGADRAFLSWPLTGQATPDDDILWWRGHTVIFPAVDFSIAVKQVMAGTSYEIAGAVLDQLEPASLPVGPTVGLAMYTNTIDKPMDVFVTNGTTDYHGTLNLVPQAFNPTFSGWNALTGAFQSVAAGANSNSRLEVFGISRIGNIFHSWELATGDNAHWSPIAQMDGTLNSIAVARNFNGTLQVFGTNSLGNIFTRNQVLGGDQDSSDQLAHPLPATDNWTSWKSIDGALTQISALTSADGFIQVYGVNSAGQVFHRQQLFHDVTDLTQNRAWTAWTQLPGPAPFRQIAVTLDSAGRTNVFALTNDDRIFQCVNLGASFTGWAQLPGKLHNIAAMRESGGSKMMVLVGSATGGGALNGIVANGVIAGTGVYRNTSFGTLGTSPTGPTPGTWNNWVLLPNPGGSPAVLTSH